MSKKEATKHDEGKPTPQYLPPKAILNVSKVFSFGEKKYGSYNYRKGFDNSRLAGAVLRHIFQYLAGEFEDEETGESHIAHATCGLLMLLEQDLCKYGNNDIKKLYE